MVLCRVREARHYISQTAEARVGSRHAGFFLSVWSYRGRMPGYWMINDEVRLRSRIRSNPVGKPSRGDYGRQPLKLMRDINDVGGKRGRKAGGFVVGVPGGACQEVSTGER